MTELSYIFKVHFSRGTLPNKNMLHALIYGAYKREVIPFQLAMVCANRTQSNLTFKSTERRPHITSLYLSTQNTIETSLERRLNVQDI
jgi:hypothetical protein